MCTVDRKRIEAPLILAIDIGTSSVRALLFDRLGRSVDGVAAHHGHTLHTTTDGGSEADPDELVETVWRCLDELLAGAGPLADRIGGVATCTLVSNLLGLDRDGRAITPITTYADSRAAGEVAGLREDLDEGAVHDRTGCIFHPSYLPARLRWIARTDPGRFGRTDRWVSIGEHMERRLFGETAVSRSVASWTGLLDRRRQVWDEALLAALPIGREHLSPLTDVSTPRRGLREPFAGRWPSLGEVPWFPAVGDGAAANVGSGCTSPDRVAVTIGTSSAVRVVVPDPVESVPRGLWCYRVDGRRSLPGGALSEGGNLFEWLRSTLRLPEGVELEAALAGMEPDAHGLTVLPFLAGERSPGWAGHARAVFDGLSLATTPMAILKAGLEAVALRIGQVYDRLRPILPNRSEARIVASGGAILSSPAWMQIVADVLGRPVAASEVREASARGAALLALEALGELEGIESAPPCIGAGYEPDPTRHDRYRAAAERQQRLYDRLIVSRSHPAS